MENLLDKIKIEIDKVNNDENHQINSNIKVDLTLSDLNEIYCLIKEHKSFILENPKYKFININIEHVEFKYFEKSKQYYKSVKR